MLTWSIYGLWRHGFGAWAAAKAHIHFAWMYNANPANLTRPVSRVMRDAANLVRAGSTGGQTNGYTPDLRRLGGFLAPPPGAAVRIAPAQ